MSKKDVLAVAAAVLLAFLLAGCISDNERAAREDKAWKDYQDKTSSLSPPPHCDELPAVKRALAMQATDQMAWVRAMSDCSGRHQAEARAVYEGAMLDLAPNSANKREREICLGIPGKKWEPMSPVDLRHCVTLPAEGRRGLREDDVWRTYESVQRLPPIECWIGSLQPKDASVPERFDSRANIRINTDCEVRAKAEARAAYRRAMLELAPDLAARRAREICFDDIRGAQTLMSPAELHNCVSRVGRP